MDQHQPGSGPPHGGMYGAGYGAGPQGWGGQ
jgi:hypothetical protein